ncbi:TonB-dependent receptor domain-containing protein [Novosphingobium sp. RL4]|uniref:TonB-dependent receptor domain-containing protein n=1 Tax=Novosphingobium sp. RL4 TaxID=3109595 RepID=UPI002D7A071C|nr:TonB-dependent receptor [Novosphingobium sp. RL4]WRT94768.1 TonB-dependent receptor [Novosphingobium sp. RL4]
MSVRILHRSAVSLIALIPAAAFAEAPAPESREILVTSAPLEETADETATPVITLVGDELAHRRQGTLGETLAGQPGIHFDNFGGGASRPVIRGQTSPRVQVLSDSANVQDASGISADHAITGEPLLLRGIEVLRGPAALLYGGGAIGGAVNLLDTKIPTAIPASGISGAGEARLGTGDDERSVVGGVTVGSGALALRLEGAHREADDYRVPGAFGERRVAGSWNESSTFTAGGSWVGPDGYLGVAYTRVTGKYGLPGHSHEYEDCHTHGASLHCGSHDDHDDDHDHGEDDHDHEHEEESIFVKMRSERFDIRGEYRDPLPGFERVRFRMAHTNYRHDEIEHDEIATAYLNKAFDVRFELTHKAVAGFRGVFGVQHSDSTFSGIHAVVEDDVTRYTPFDISNTALFLHESRDFGPVRIEAAVRQEWQRIRPQTSLAAFMPSSAHDPFSVSASALWKVADGYSLALSLARSQRAPNVQELYAFGPHFASNTYEIGMVTGRTFNGMASTENRLETGKSINLTFRKTSGATTFTLGAYHQRVDNYIYGQTLDQYEEFRLIHYVAADATFTGVDGELRHQIMPELGVSLFGDYVRAKLKDDLGNLPRIPPGRLGTRVDAATGPFTAEAEYYRTFKQDRIADFETATPGYDMLNLTLSYKLDLGTDRWAELFARGTNLTNSFALNHASFVKDASPLRGRNFVFGVRTAF